jgi:hypothetical protein
MWVWFVSLTRRLPSTPKYLLVLISVRGWAHPRAIVWLEGLGKLKNLLPQWELNPRPPLLVGQWLNQLRYHVPPTRTSILCIYPLPFGDVKRCFWPLKTEHRTDKCYADTSDAGFLGQYLYQSDLCAMLSNRRAYDSEIQADDVATSQPCGSKYRSMLPLLPS